MSFRGVSLPNNSYVDIGGFDDIGAGVTQVCDAQALLCHTDKRDCCSPPQTSSRNKLGDWYFPNRTAIVAITETFEKGLHDYFARNRDLGVIRLYVSGVPLERGRFQCEVPNANDVMETLYANICELMAIIYFVEHSKIK